MLVPLSWLGAILPELDAGGREVAEALIRVGLEVERVEVLGIEELFVGRVVDFTAEPQKNGKTVRWCQVDAGGAGPRGIVCGAANFEVGDLVVAALPGAVLPGDFAISARKTYRHVSDGMICSSRELGIGTDHDGILVLDPEAYPGAEPGDDAADLLDLVDEVLDIAVTPDRGYCLSLRGIAREAAVALHLPYIDPGARVLPGGLRRGVDVTLADPAGCDHYVAVTIDGLDSAARTPSWMARRLERAGTRTVTLAVDVTNYVMLELGQPLHAFDADLVAGAIVVRRATAGERLRTLDGSDRSLELTDLVIADDSGPIALAGVMGGARTEIGASTRRVLLEAAHFPAMSVARSVRRHRLPSEAARRYERGVDPALCIAAAAAAAALLADLGGASAVAYTEVDLRPPLPHITLPVGFPGQVGGRAVPPAVVRMRLEQVGANLSGADPLTVTPPPWRPDLTEPIDLVEEVLRLEGYDTLPIRVPVAPAGRGLTLAQRQRRASSRALAGAGFVEVQTVPFTAADPLGLPAGDPRRDAVQLLNPLSAAEGFLRTSLLPGLLAALARNVSRGQRDLALYETGAVFAARGAARTGQHFAPPPAGVRPTPETLAALDATLPAQPQHAAVALTGRADPAGWWGPGRPADWSDAVGAVIDTAAAVGVTLDARPASYAPWHPGRCAELLAGTVIVGHAGELHPGLLERLDLPPRVCAAEWSLDAVFVAATAGEPPVAQLVSTFPPGIVDIALVVADSVPVAEVLAAVVNGAGELLESAVVFDLYRGAPIPAGQHSVAVTLTFRAPDRTLAGEEVNALRDRAVAAAADATEAQLRA